jgi:excisionase family DNA binding protein
LETYLTVEELAAYFKFSEQTIRRWIFNREIPFHKINNSVRFRLSEIETWVEKKDALLKASCKEKDEVGLFDEPKAAKSGGEA